VKTTNASLLGRLVRSVNYRLTSRVSQRGLPGFIDDQLRRVAGNGARPRILTVGAGGPLGGRVERLRDAADVVSVDIDPARGPDVVASFTDLAPFGANRFDAVFAMEVLEHVTEPHLAIAEAHRVLKPGGVLVASTPFIFEQHDTPHDYYRYTRFGLEHLLRAFRERTIVARSGYFTAAIVPLMRLSHRDSVRDLAVGTAAVAFAYACYPAVAALDWWIESDEATVGFTIVAVK
jgi:SAM-dependent methyltransferase